MSTAKDQSPDAPNAQATHLLNTLWQSVVAETSNCDVRIWSGIVKPVGKIVLISEKLEKNGWKIASNNEHFFNKNCSK